ncbi:MAG: NAD-glutamate dehydrogenase [Gammaproteobacteria bacterium]|nr:NAD-glutamate dehydrogenase [Gammaproteobacteria bacterium]
MDSQLPVVYFRNVPPADLGQRSQQDLAGAARAHFDLANRWRRGHHGLRVYNPALAEHGWSSPHTIVEIVTRDRPFLIDSLTVALNRQGFTQHLVVHPILWVTRATDGSITAIAAMDATREGAGRAEAWIHLEIDQERDAARLQALRRDLERTLDDVRAAVTDWPAMTARLEQEAVALPTAALGAPKPVVAQAAAFLRWLLDNNFTLLGIRDYRLVEADGGPQLQALPGSGLGILRGGGRAHVSRSFAETPLDLRVHARPGEILTLTKANSRSTVHRPDRLDYIGIKRYGDDGRVCGELRLLGLYTSSAHLGSPRTIPIVRDKIAAVIQQAKLLPQSHDGKALAHILDTYPRQELFEASVRELTETAIGILHLQERQRVRLFVRPDAFGRYVACQVFVPRDLFDTTRRRRIEQILLDAFDGEQLEFTLKLSEAPLAQLYFVVHTRQRRRRRLVTEALEARIAAAVRSWSADLHEALVAAHGEDQGLDYWRRYAEAFATAYQETNDAATAVTDLGYIEAALTENRIQTHIESAGAGDAAFVFKLFSPGGFIEQSAILPILENMGVTVRLQQPHRVALAPAQEVWIHDHDCRAPGAVAVTGEVQAIFEEAVAAAWYGLIENDGLNALVLRQGLAARDISVLRAYARYLKQIGTPYGTDYVIETLVRHGVIARTLFDLFVTRLRLDRRGAARAEETIRHAIEARLEAVSSLDEDRILRLLYRLIGATCRTNFFQRDASGAAKPYLAIKLRPELLPELPRPLPAFEIFVCSPRVEGVHLRGGPVARGGIRWSDRREDYRTEVLGLMRAQTVKNAVIVPVGAKGGFFVKRPPADPRARIAEGLDCYRTFIRGLLDLTDNLVDGRVVPPRDTVRHDGDDPYLVVAADKGTASFSDTANAIAADYGFWLGDAFASGGSAGYDHKKMGITARGAWESVCHAFQLLGRDIRREPFTVVGIGDMSGDVFGHGLLLSRQIRLIAAFNHQHIFIDPNPDPEMSFDERRRLFRLPGSSWDDYDRKRLSRGGGIHPRSLKSIRLRPQARAALGTAVEAATPEDLSKMVMTEPVDLL